MNEWTELYFLKTIRFSTLSIIHPPQNHSAIDSNIARTYFLLLPLFIYFMANYFGQDFMHHMSQILSTYAILG